MKKHLPLLLSAGLLALGLAGCASSAGGPSRSAHTLETGQGRDLLPPYPTDERTGAMPAYLNSVESVSHLDKRDVLQRFGRPAERLTPDLWIYWRFYAPEDAAENGGHDTLVVTFARGRVDGMKLVRGDILRARLAGTWAPPAELARR